MTHLMRLLRGSGILAVLGLVVWAWCSYKMVLAGVFVAALVIALAYFLGVLYEMMREDMDRGRAAKNPGARAGQSIWP